MLATSLPENVLEATQLTEAGANDIVVLLPLSGRLARTGQVVKNGIMAAYYTDVEKRQDEKLLPRLRFIDTHGADSQQLVDEIGSTKFVIGPLLKDTIEHLVPNLPIGVNVLALNRPDDLPVHSESKAHWMLQQHRYYVQIIKPKPPRLNSQVCKVNSVN